MRRVALSCLLLALASACSSTRTLSGDLVYGKSAEDDYKSGLEEMKGHNWPEATKFFERVRTKYPFSRFSPLAELRIADAKYEQEHFVEAAEAYAQFVKLHPNHDDVDYAAFRVGVSKFHDGPSEFILFPPSYEKDLSTMREATKSLAEFVARYPESKYRPEADKMLATARGKLADHEWYAAEFYAKRNHWPAVTGRLETLVKEYPGTRRESDALLALAKAYVRLDDRFRAQQALQRLIVKHPEDPRRPEAEKLLASLR